MLSKRYSISNTNILIGIFIGLITAVFIYGFFSLTIDCIRYICLESLDKELIFSGEYRNYFNVFFAGLGVLMGQSYAIQYLLSSSSLKSYYKSQINNDNQWFPWIVFFFIAKGISILIWYRTIFLQDSFKELLPTIRLVMFTLLAVLFVYSWNALRRYLIGTRFVIVLGGLLVFFCLAFSIAQIQWIDRKMFDEMALSNNVVYTHNIQYPQSVVVREIHRKSSIIDLFIGRNKKTGKVEVFNESDQLDIQGIPEYLEGERNSHMRYSHIGLGLHIDKKLTLEELMPVFYQFHLSNMKRIAVYIDSEDGDKDKVFNYKLLPNLLYDYVKHHVSENVDSVLFNQYSSYPKAYIVRETNAIELFTDSIETRLYNDPFLESDYETELDRSFNEFGSSVVVTAYFIDLKTTFGDYIYTKSQLFKAHYKLRELEALKKYNKPYEGLSREEKRTIRKMYPISVWELGLYSVDKERIKAFYNEQHNLVYNNLEQQAKR